MKLRNCSECHNQMEAKTIAQEYEREGITVKIEGIPAMVCPNCGAISFTPGMPDKIKKAFDSMYVLAEEKHKGSLLGRC